MYWPLCCIYGYPLDAVPALLSPKSKWLTSDRMVLVFRAFDNTNHYVMRSTFSKTSTIFDLIGLSVSIVIIGKLNLQYFRSNLRVISKTLLNLWKLHKLLCSIIQNFIGALPRRIPITMKLRRISRNMNSLWPYRLQSCKLEMKSKVKKYHCI